MKKKLICLLFLSGIVVANSAFAERTEIIDVYINKNITSNHAIEYRPKVANYEMDACSGDGYKIADVLGDGSDNIKGYDKYDLKVNGKFAGDKRNDCKLNTVNTYFNVENMKITFGDNDSCTINNFGLTYLKKSFITTDYHYDALVGNNEGSTVSCSEKNGHKYKIIPSKYTTEANGQMYYAKGYILID